MMDDGLIKHNGRAHGYLYQINEPIESGDIHPHPHPVNESKWEWLTNREIEVELICEDVEVLPEEFLTDDDILALKQLQAEQGAQTFLR